MRPLVGHLRGPEGFREEVRYGCISARLAFHLELCSLPPKHVLYRVHFDLVDTGTPYYKVKEKTTPNLSLLHICLFLLRNLFAQSKSPLCGAWLVAGKQRATSPPSSLLVVTSRLTGRQEAAPGWCLPI